MENRKLDIEVAKIYFGKKFAPQSQSQFEMTAPISWCPKYSSEIKDAMDVAEILRAKHNFAMVSLKIGYETGNPSVQVSHSGWKVIVDKQEFDAIELPLAICLAAVGIHESKSQPTPVPPQP